MFQPAVHWKLYLFPVYILLVSLICGVVPAHAQSEQIVEDEIVFVTYENGTVSAEWAVDFLASPIEGYPPLCVTFTLEGPLGEYYWDFGDGTHSSSRNPVHCYQKQGFYWVKLKYFVGETHGEVTKENYITVKDPMTFVDFTAEPSIGTNPLSVQFSIIGEPTNIIWDFDDGEQSTQWNPFHQYTQPGFYTPTLTYCLDGACEKISKYNFIEISAAEEVNFTAERQEGLAPLSTKFFAHGPADTYSWDFGDGTSSYKKDPGHFYNEPGLYSVTLTYSIDGASYSVTKNDYIRVRSKFIPDFSASPNSGIAPLCVDFEMVNHPQSWLWDFGDNTTSPDDYAAHCYGLDGTYSVGLEYCYNGLCDVVEKPELITVFAPRIFAEPGDDDATWKFRTDSNDGVKYFWDFGDMTMSESAAPIHQYEKPETYNVTVSILGICGCYARAETIVRVDPKKPMDFSGTPLQGCAPHCVQFRELSPEIPKSREWDFGDGETSDEKNPFHCYQFPGKYRVSLRNEYPGHDENVTKPDYVTVNAMPSPSFSYFPTSGYPPLKVVCTDTTRTPGIKRYWDFGDGTTGTEDRVEHTFTEDGTYNISLKVWNDGDCMDEKVQQVHVLKPEEIRYDIDAQPRRGIAPLCSSFRILGNPPQWEVDFGDGQVTTEKGPFHCYETAGIYSPKLHACDYGGCEDVVKPDYIVAIPQYYEKLSLSQGWNLVSTPISLEPLQSTVRVFSGVDTAGHSLFSWNSASGQWTRLNEDSSFSPLIGVWIYAQEQTEIILPIAKIVTEGNFTQPLAQGWNLISFPGIAKAPVSEVFPDELNWSYLLGFDAIGQRFLDPIEKGRSDPNQMIDPQLGYWIYMSGPGMFVSPAL